MILLSFIFDFTRPQFASGALSWSLMNSVVACAMTVMLLVPVAVVVRVEDAPDSFAHGVLDNIRRTSGRQWFSSVDLVVNVRVVALLDVQQFGDFVGQDTAASQAGAT